MGHKFERGQFGKYRATNNIHLGRYLVDIKLDGLFEYDGAVVRYEGVAYEVPQLQGLYGQWFVPQADKTTQYRSQPANVQVRAATPEGEARGASFSMGRASEEEAVVGTMDQAKEIRTAASSDQVRLAELREQRRAEAARRAGLADPLQDSNPDAPPPRNAADVDPEVEAALMDDMQQQYIQARPVHQAGAQGGMSASEAELRAVAEANRLNQERIARATAELERLDPRKTKEEMGGTRHDVPDQGMRKVGGGKYGLIRDEQDDGVPVGHYKFSGGATVGNAEDARNVAAAKPTDVTRVAAQQPVQVGQAVASTPATNRHAGAAVYDDPMTTHSPQAVRARNTTQVRRGDGNVGIDDIGPGGSTGDVDIAASSDDLTELLPTAAVAGLNARRAATPPKKTEAEEIQEVLDGWSTKRNWQKRVEEAIEFYADWPEALTALYSIESPAVVKQIQERLAAKIAEG